MKVYSIKRETVFFYVASKTFDALRVQSINNASFNLGGCIRVHIRINAVTLYSTGYRVVIAVSLKIHSINEDAAVATVSDPRCTSLKWSEETIPSLNGVCLHFNQCFYGLHSQVYQS